MEDLMQIKLSLRVKMDKLIFVKNIVALRMEGGVDDVNRLLKMLEVIEANVAESTSKLQSSGSLDKEFVQRVNQVLIRLESFLQAIIGDHMKGKAKMFEEESKEKLENLLQPFFRLLKEEEITMAIDQAIEQHNKRTLFKNKTFKDEETECNNQILLEIAEELFNKYYHNPILLDLVAALFSSKKTAKEWESCRDKVSLGDASKTNPFYLKLSNYERLPSNIQMCARYCSLFSKDYTFNKTDLIHLWASQQEDLLSTAATKSVGDEYFEELLKKGYFFEIIQEGTGCLLMPQN